MSRLITPALIPVAFQAIDLSNSTAVALNSTVQASATTLHVSVETNSVRYRVDGTDPALTTGVLLAAGDHWITGYNGTSTFSFQRSTGTAKVSIMAYRQGTSR